MAWWCYWGLLVLLLGVCGAGGQSVGNVCTRVDGSKGVCRNLKECVDQGGSGESAGRVQLCVTQNFNRVVVCCRTSAANIARNKCFGWQQQRIRSGSACTSTVPLVRGGDQANVGEFPHIVSLLEDNPEKGLIHVCGGSLIAPNWVLTAAHCIQNTRLLVRLGAHDLREPEHGLSLVVEVRRRIIHPQYKTPRRYNDIALLQLHLKAPVTPRIQPACLPYDGRRIPAGQTLVVAGWGRTGPGQPASNVLRRAEVKSISRLECARNPHHTPQGIAAVSYPVGITDSILCVEEVEQGSCQGDSGGPLMYESGEACVQEVVGLVSRGRPSCSSTTVPALYTRVQYYLEWIVATIWKEEL